MYVSVFEKILNNGNEIIRDLGSVADPDPGSGAFLTP
jgi:hypothetical protein